jgi:hypothetical protein
MSAQQALETCGSHTGLTDGGEVVSPKRRSYFTPQEDSSCLFLLEA